MQFEYSKNMRATWSVFTYKHTLAQNAQKRKENSDTSLPTVPATCLNKTKIAKRILRILTQLHLQEQFKQVVSHPLLPLQNNDARI